MVEQRLEFHMGAGSAPEVKLPDVGLVFGISLLIGYILMTIK